MMSPNSGEGDQFPPLSLTTQTSSLYNLTFDEVQTQLGKIGKPLNAMNLDELLKSVLAVEGGLLQNPSSSSSTSSSLFLQNFNLNGTLSKKTVDEVWKEIVGHGNVNVNPMDHNNQFVDHQQQQLSTLGETTLEDFLVRAGVINTGSSARQDGTTTVLNPQQFMAIDPMAVVSQQADWLQFQMAVTHQQQQQPQPQPQPQMNMNMMDSNFNVPESAYENQGVVDVGYPPENQRAIAMPMHIFPSLFSLFLKVNFLFFSIFFQFSTPTPLWVHEFIYLTVDSDLPFFPSPHDHDQTANTETKQYPNLKNLVNVCSLRSIIVLSVLFNFQVPFLEFFFF